MRPVYQDAQAFEISIHAGWYTGRHMKQRLHTTWIEVSASSLRHNIVTLRELVDPNVCLAATVKANAYGHGATQAGKIFLAAGADWLSVHSLDEALDLRAAGIQAPLYILGFVPTERLSEVIEHDIDLVLYDESRLREIARQAKAKQVPAKIHLKLETGLHRQGVSTDEVVRLAQFIKGNEWLLLRGITSHFANIEDTSASDFAELQYRRFSTCLQQLKQQDITPEFHHMANSAAAMLYPGMHGNLVRPGIACYGIWPSRTTRQQAEANRPSITLRPAFTWKALVSQVKHIGPGDTVGYGRTYTPATPTRIAVIPVGYYEGFDRRAGNEGYVLIGGQRAPVVGRVSMNNIMVDCSDCGPVRPEDEVVLLGRQGEAEITAEEVAAWTDRIVYEVPTRIGATLSATIPRIVVE